MSKEKLSNFEKNKYNNPFWQAFIKGDLRGDIGLYMLFVDSLKTQQTKEEVEKQQNSSQDLGL